MQSKGKKFEKQFEQDWKGCFPNDVIIRLPDQQSGYYGTSSNICDYICFTHKTLFLIECKSHAGNTFPFSCLRQFDKLNSYKGIDNVVPCVILWLYDIDKVFFIPISTVEKMINDGKKSFNGKTTDKSVYPYIDVPSSKKRTFMVSDYTVLFEEINNDSD